MAYLYRHIRLDKNEPFYIGIGSDEKYTRAHNKKGRSHSWKDIVYKIGYKVEIMLENLTWEEACKKEKFFIKFYGRKDLGTGILVNFTDGGEGQWGRKDTNLTKIKKQKPKSMIAKINMKKSHENRDYLYLKGKAGSKLGIKKSKEHTIKIQEAANDKKIKVKCIELDIIFNSLTEASKILKMSSGHISNVLSSKTHKTRNNLTLTKI